VTQVQNIAASMITADIYLSQIPINEDCRNHRYRNVLNLRHEELHIMVTPSIQLYIERCTNTTFGADTNTML